MVSSFLEPFAFIFYHLSQQLFEPTPKRTKLLRASGVSLISSIIYCLDNTVGKKCLNCVLFWRFYKSRNLQWFLQYSVTFEKRKIDFCTFLVSKYQNAYEEKLRKICSFLSDCFYIINCWQFKRNEKILYSFSSWAFWSLLTKNVQKSKNYIVHINTKKK